MFTKDPNNTTISVVVSNSIRDFFLTAHAFVLVFFAFQGQCRRLDEAHKTLSGM